MTSYNIITLEQDTVYSEKMKDKIKQAGKSRKRIAFGAQLKFSIARSVSTSTIQLLKKKGHVC